MALPPQIARYEVQGRIGRGGMGSLYLARDPRIDRLVAIKVLHADMDRDDLRQRFDREARAAGTLSHPNIVTIFDYGVFDDAPYIVMEYIRGETVAELIKRQASLPVTQRLAYLQQLCRGLAFAHEAGIVHRDIKPANLMIDQHDVLKILDFGIARLGESTLTQMSVSIGTPGYMSPEQIDGRSVDRSSDVFSLGAVAYELLSFRRAFAGDTQQSIINNVLHTVPRPLTEILPELDKRVAAIVHRALEKSPPARFQDAGSMLRELQRLGAAPLEQANTDRTAVLVPESPRNTPLDDAQVEQLLKRARSEIDRELLTEAGSSIAEALRIQPRSSAALKLRAELDDCHLRRERLASQRVRAREAVDRAHRHMKDGAREAARRAVDEALALDPENTEARAMRDAPLATDVPVEVTVPYDRARESPPREIPERVPERTFSVESQPDDTRRRMWIALIAGGVTVSVILAIVLSNSGTSPSPTTSPSPPPVATTPPSNTPREPATTPAKPAPATPPGQLRVRSTLAFGVFEGGKKVGTVGGSIAGTLALAPGSHTLELVNEETKFRTRVTVNAQSGSVTQVPVSLPSVKISINAAPYADVFIDGKPVGQTPLGGLPVEIGRHELLFKHPQLGEQRKSIVVMAEGGATAFTHTFQQK